MANVLLVTKTVKTVERCEAALKNLGYDFSLFVCPDGVWEGPLKHGTFDLIITEATDGSSFADELLLMNRNLVQGLPIVVIVDSFKESQKLLDCGCDVSLVEQPIDQKILQEKINFALFFHQLNSFCMESDHNVDA